jgi:hypothetical protein
VVGRRDDVPLPAPDDGVIAALEMLEAVSAAELPPAHIGLLTGRSCSRAATTWGEPVNVAARIAEQGNEAGARHPGDRDRIGPGDVVFEPIDAFLLEGVSEPVLLDAAQRS